MYSDENVWKCMKMKTTTRISTEMKIRSKNCNIPIHLFQNWKDEI